MLQETLIAQLAEHRESPKDAWFDSRSEYFLLILSPIIEKKPNQESRYILCPNLAFMFYLFVPIFFMNKIIFFFVKKSYKQTDFYPLSFQKQIW